MKLTMLFMVVFLFGGIASQAFAESVDENESRVIEIRLESFSAILGSQQKQVMGTNELVWLDAEHIELLYMLLSSFLYVPVEHRLAQDNGFMYRLMEFDEYPKFEYVNSGRIEFSNINLSSVRYTYCIFFSKDERVIGEHTKYNMPNNVSLNDAYAFMNKMEFFCRNNFGHIVTDIGPPAIDMGNYQFWLTNEFGDELHFAWYGQFVVVTLRAGDLRAELATEKLQGLFLLPEAERELWNER